MVAIGHHYDIVPSQARAGQQISLHYTGVMVGRGFGSCAARFSAQRAPDGENGWPGRRGNNPRAKWNFSKIPMQNNNLRRKFDRGRVLFVQHPSEKASSQVVGSGSFIACAEVLGNCDVATEGGIPRSSR